MASKPMSLPTQVSRIATKRVLQELNKTRKAFEKAGLKSKLPTTLTAYTKAYTGSKQFARSDYVFEVMKELERFYNKQGRAVEKKQSQLEESGFSISTSTTMQRREGNSIVRFLQTTARDITTLTNVANPEYLAGDMTDAEKSKLVKKRSRRKNDPQPIMQAGRRKATLKTFQGSQLRLAYNNFLVGLSNLGYVKTLNQVLTLSPSQWSSIFNAHANDLELVFKYSQFVGSGDDDIFAEWFGGEPADEVGLEYEDEGDEW